MRDWKSVQLKDAGTWLSGGTPFTDNPRYWDGDIPWISAASLKDFQISRSDRRITELGAISGTRLVPPGTVLFVVRGMSLKTEFRVGITERQVAFGQDCKAIIPARGIDAKFLALALKARSRDVLAMVDEAGHGTGRLPTDLIANLKIDVPALPEQQRITEIIDSADDQIRATEAALRKLTVLKSGVIRAAFDGMPQATERSTVEALFSIKSGITLGPHRLPGEKASKYLRVANVQRAWIDISDVALLQASTAEKVGLQLAVGDLLVVEGHANPDEIGRCALVDSDAVGLLYQNHLFRLRSAKVDPEFAELWLNSDETRAYWRRMTATSSGLYTINSRMLRELPFPIVAPEDQANVVNAQRLVASTVKVLHEELDKLRLIKWGVMDDLLTGQMRIPKLCFCFVEFAARGDVAGRGEDLYRWSSSSSRGSEGAAGLAAGARSSRAHPDDGY
jgi:hypothetical protein